MDSIIDKDNSPDFKKPVNFVSPVVRFRSMVEKVARLLAKRVSDRAGRISEISIKELADRIVVGIEELISFLSKRANLSKVRILVSKRMYGIKLSFDGDCIRFGAIG